MIQANSIILSDCKDLLNRINSDSIDMCYIDPPFFNQSKEKCSYIDWMKDILIQIHRVLKETGSIFVHCDHRTNYKLRYLLNEVFQPNHFINEIIWCYKIRGSNTRSFCKTHDTIFFYSKTNKYKFNLLKLNPAHRKKNFTTMLDLRDWIEIPMLSTYASERTGYPNQKPLPLLYRLIQCSTNKGDIILDCFAGSGTTAEASINLDRNFIVGDISSDAVTIIKKRIGVTNF